MNHPEIGRCYDCGRRLEDDEIIRVDEYASTGWYKVSVCPKCNRKRTIGNRHSIGCCVPFALIASASVVAACRFIYQQFLV